MEDNGAVASPEDSGVLDAETEPIPALVDEEEPQADDNDDTAAGDDDDEEGAARRRRGRGGREEDEEVEEGVLKDPPYEYPTGLVAVDDQ